MEISSLSSLSFQGRLQNRTQKPVSSVTSLGVDEVSFTGAITPQFAAKKLAKVVNFMIKPLEQGYTIPALNINNMESLQAVIAAAKVKKSPIIVQVSAGARKYAGGEDTLVAMFKSTVKELKKAKIPVILHLDHGEDFKVCKGCIDAGFDSVMIDASKHDFKGNVELTKQVVDYAHSKGVFVEAELGRIAGTEDNISVSAKEALYTDPKEAAEFVKLTGCDSLAISVGTKHGPVKFEAGEEPKLDFDRIKAIKREIELILPENAGKTPEDPTWKQYALVLHGASSAPKDLVDKVNEFFVIPRNLGNAIKAFISYIQTVAHSPEVASSSKISELMVGEDGLAGQILKGLEIHGKEVTGKGVPEEMYSKVMGLIAKLNVDTDLRMGFSASVKRVLAGKPTAIDPREYLKVARTTQQEIAERKMDILGSAGKA